MKKESKAALVVKMQACKKQGCAVPEATLPMMVKTIIIKNIKKVA